MDQEYMPTLKKVGNIVAEIKNNILHKGIVNKIYAREVTTLLVLYWAAVSGNKYSFFESIHLLLMSACGTFPYTINIIVFPRQASSTHSTCSFQLSSW